MRKYVSLGATEASYIFHYYQETAVMNISFKHLSFNLVAFLFMTSINTQAMRSTINLKHTISCTEAFLNQAQALYRHPNQESKIEGINLFKQMVQCGKGFKEAKEICEYHGYFPELSSHTLPDLEVKKTALELLAILIKNNGTHQVDLWEAFATAAIKTEIPSIQSLGIDLLINLVGQGYKYEKALRITRWNFSDSLVRDKQGALFQTLLHQMSNEISINE